MSIKTTILLITTKTTIPSEPIYLEDGLSSVADKSHRLFLFVKFGSVNSSDLNNAIFLMSSSSVMVYLLHEHVHRVPDDKRYVVSTIVVFLDVAIVLVVLVVTVDRS